MVIPLLWELERKQNSNLNYLIINIKGQLHPVRLLQTDKGEAMSKNKVPPGYKVIFCKSIRKNGKTIYPKHGKVFRLVVKDK